MMKRLKWWLCWMLNIMKRLKRCKWLTNDYFLRLYSWTMMFRCSWWLRWLSVTCSSSVLLMNKLKLLIRMKWRTSCVSFGELPLYFKLQSWKRFGQWINIDKLERSNVETIRTESTKKDNCSCFNGEFSGFNNGLNACCWRNNKKSIWINTVFNECNRRRHLLFHGVCNCTRWHNDWCAN